MNNKTIASLVLALLLALQCFAPVVMAEEATTCVEHKWVDNDNGVLKDADCTKGILGIKGQYCEVCKKTQFVSFDGHAYAEPAITEDATCTTDAKVGEKCSICGDVKNEQVVEGTATGHKFVDVHVDATCVSPAGIQKKCSACGEKGEFVPYKEGEEGYEPALGTAHTPVKGEKNKAASCQQNGWEGQIVCKTCGVELEKGVEVKKGEAYHNFEEVVIKAASCANGTNGISQLVCEFCGKTNGYVSVAFKHTMRDAAEVLPTCTTPGKGFRFCSNEGCDEKEENVVFPATDHKETIEVPVAATCTEPAKVEIRCKACNELISSKAVENSKPLGHTVEEGTDALHTADCTGPEGISSICAVCGEKVFTEMDINGDGVVTAKLAHKEKASDKNKAATCGTAGWEGATICEFCNVVVNPGKETPATGVHVKVASTKAEEIIKNVEECGDIGIAKAACKECGKVLDGYVSFTKEHVFDKANYTYPEGYAEATCEKEGKAKVKCSNCDFAKDVVVEKKPHSYTKDEMPATCVTPAYKGSFCECGAINPEVKAEIVSEALGHVAADPVKEEVSCAYAEGFYVYCEKCEELIEFIADDIDGDGKIEAKLEHNYQLSKENKPATCVEEGLEGKIVCLNCGDVKEKGKVLPIDEDAHKLVADVENPIKEDNCKKNEKGIAKAICKNEGCEYVGEYIYFDPIHDWKTVEHKAATCGEDGFEDKVCNICEAEERKVLEATGKHNFAEDDTFVIEATCTTPEYTGKACTVCGQAAEGEELKVTAPALGHKYDIGSGEAVVEATCENPTGVKVVCNVCKEEAFIDLPENDPGYQAALGHKEVSGDKAPTCKSIGYEGRVVCERCDKVIVKGTELKPVSENHVESKEGTVVSIATCSKNGVKKYSCVECGEVLRYETYKAEHKFGAEMYDEVENYVYKQCTVCEAIEVIQEFDECEHKAADAVKEKEVAATCTKAGSYDEVVYCSVCKEELTRVAKTVDALGHTEEVLAAKAATCTETGLTEGKKCTVCEEILLAQEEVAALGHTWDEGVVTTQPTEEAEGVKTYTCACGETKTEAIEKLEHVHKYTISWSLNDDATKKIKTFNCTCGYSYSEEISF